jgi:hypothetical protein
MKSAKWRAVEVFRENAKARARLEAEAQTERAREANRQRVLEDMIAHFRENVNAIVATLNARTGDMGETARHLGAVAARANGAAGEANSAANLSSKNMPVSSAAEELTSSIHEILRQIEGMRARRPDQRLGPGHRPSCLRARRPGGKNRRHRRDHQGHRPADQHAGAQRNNRGCARRRSRARFCGGRLGGQDAGRTYGAGDRRDQRPDRGDSSRHL